MTTDLIKKLEALTGPDRGVDAEVLECAYNLNIPLEYVPAFTSSVDVAIALAERVLPDCSYLIQPNSAEIIDNKCCEYTCRSAFNPAIALCIAILKATEAQDAQ